MSWILAHSSTFTGPKSAVAAGAELEDGWYDNSGGIWSVTSDGYLSSLQASVPKNTGLLLRSADASQINQRIVTQLKIKSNVSFFVVLRSDGNTAGATQYEMSINASCMLAAVIGGSTNVLKQSSVNAPLVDDEVVTVDASVTQKDSATTTLSLLITDSSGNTIYSQTVDDTATQLQNVSGHCGVFSNEGVAQGSANSVLVKQIDTYSYSTQTLTVVPVNDKSFLFSPGNWSGDTGRSGSAWRRSWNCGAWFEFVFKGSSSPSLNLLVGSSTCAATLTAYVNGVEVLTRATASGSIAVSGLAVSSDNTVRVLVSSAGNGDRYNGAKNSVTVTGAQIDSASSPETARTLGEWGMFVGSSRTEGFNAVAGGIEDWTKDYSGLVADTLLANGIDVCISACSGSDYLLTGDGGQVPAYYPNASGQTARWNLVDAGISLLDSAGHISAYGETGSEPKFICIDLFSNGATNGGDTAAMSAAMVACMASLRGAAPNAWIFVVVPSGFYYSAMYPTKYLSALKAAFQTYNSTYPSDGRTSLIDLGQDLSLRITSAVGLYVNSDHVHPLEAGHAKIAPVIVSGIQKAISGPTYQV